MEHRSEDCKYCPPLNFTAHRRCHEESIKFKLNTKRLRKSKENIPLDHLIRIFKQKKWLDLLYQTCISEQNYYFHMLHLKNFNNMVETYLDLREL
jgi:hypothetical protein